MIICVFLFILNSQFGYTQSLNNCTNWANIIRQNYNSINCGNISITGHNLTVEALISRTTDYDGTNLGDVVSKHNGPEDCNYLLRPDRAQITTPRGHFSTPPVCMIEKNKTYHIAMTYDGNELIFYRNGIRMSSVSCSGDLYTNGFNTRIGMQASQFYPISTFIGYINEVRIWNVTRTADQIRNNRATSLLSPTTTTGLLAYYQFNDLKNKQRNSQFDAQIDNNTLINQTVPSCQLDKEPCPNVCTIPIYFSNKMDDCDNRKYSLQSSVTENINSFNWSSDENTTIESPNSSTTIIHFLTNGAHQVTLDVENSNGCIGSISKSFDIEAPPIIPILNKPSNNLVCPNTPTDFSLNSALVYQSVKWYENDQLLTNTDPTITLAFPQNAILKAEIVNENGCTLSDQIEIEVRSKPNFSISDDHATICKGNALNLTANGGDFYKWYDENNTILSNENNLTNTPNASENIYVEITENTCNNSEILTSNIVVLNIPNISLTKSNDISCLKSNATLLASGGTNYIWNDFPNSNNVSSQTIEPTQSTTYSIIGVDKNNCQDTATVSVVVDENISSIKFYVPSAFTPNNDGRNDQFRVISNATFSRFNLRIFNRWGNLVFSSNNISNGWNGEYKGKKIAGTYIYEVIATNFCKEFYKKGTIVLIQ